MKNLIVLIFSESIDSHSDNDAFANKRNCDNWSFAQS